MNTHIYNSKIIDYYIKLIKQKYSHINVIDLLKFADMKPYEVDDQSHWFTQDQVNRFYEKLVQMSGNDQIAREAGRYAASPDALGVMRQYVLGSIGPANAFEIINKATLSFTRSSTYASSRISANSVEIVVTPCEGVTEKPFQCENRIGFFEAMVTVFGYKLPRVEHTECIFKGAKSCLYLISWESSRSLTFKRIGVGISLMVVIVIFVVLIIIEYVLLQSL